MFLEGEFFQQSCANEFAFNFGVMMAAVWHLAGLVVVGGQSTALCPPLQQPTPAISPEGPNAYKRPQRLAVPKARAVQEVRLQSRGM